MAEKEIITFRADNTLKNYIHARSKEYDVYVTEVLYSLIKVGMEHTKEVKKDLERKQKLAIETIKFNEADAFVKMEVKKAYTLSNMKKLMRRLAQDREIDRDRLEDVANSLIARIETVFGAKSKEYREANKWLKQGSRG